MSIKEFWQDVSKAKLLVLIITMFIASFDGVVISQVISSVTKFTPRSSLRDIIFLTTYGLVAYFLVQISSYCVSILSNNIINQLNQKYKREVIKSIYSTNKPKKDVGSTISLLTVDLKLIEEKYFSVILKCFYYVLLGIVSLLYLIYLSPIISILFILCSFLPILPSLLFGKMLGRATEKYTYKNERFVKNLRDLAQGFSEISTYNAFSTFFSDTKNIIKEMENSQEALGNKHSFVGMIASMLSWLGYLIPISVALFFIIKGEMDIQIVIALFLASDRVISPFRNLSEYVRLFKSTEITREKIKKLISSSNRTNKVLENNVLEKPNIFFKNVSFGFDDILLKDVTFDIPYGSKVLIKGVSGSGKSTLLDLIQGKIEPTQGQITFWQNDCKTMITSNDISRIQQDPYYFDLSLRDNILMGSKDIKDTEIMAILEHIGLIDELGEHCLDKLYGEQGKELSGGQKQRVEIARALLHNKKILLVDEGTSAVNKELSEKIRTIFFNLNITVLEVAHNYSRDSIHNYSHCLEISNGRIDFYKIN